MAKKKHEPKFHIDLTFDVYVNAGGGGAIMQAEAIDSFLTSDPSAGAQWIADQISIGDYKDSSNGSGEDSKLFMDWGGVTVRVSVESEDYSSDSVDAREFTAKVRAALVKMGLKDS